MARLVRELPTLYGTDERGPKQWRAALAFAFKVLRADCAFVAPLAARARRRTALGEVVDCATSATTIPTTTTSMAAAMIIQKANRGGYIRE